MKKVINARLMMIVSMIIFGTLASFVRNISVSSGELALYRAILAALLIAGFLIVTKQKIPFANIKKAIPLLLVSGIAMGINGILLFEAYKYTTVSVATLSYYFAPVIVTIVCSILFLIPYVLMTSGVTLGRLNHVGWVNLLIVGGGILILGFTLWNEIPSKIKKNREQ